MASSTLKAAQARRRQLTTRAIDERAAVMFPRRYQDATLETYERKQNLAESAERFALAMVRLHGATGFNADEIASQCNELFVDDIGEECRVVPQERFEEMANHAVRVWEFLAEVVELVERKNGQGIIGEADDKAKAERFDEIANLVWDTKRRDREVKESMEWMADAAKNRGE